MMTDFRLKTFCAAAKYLSFTKAAHELNITQPAVTKHIHELEANYDTRLFERKGNSLVLTHAGEILLHHSKIILKEYSHLEFVMNMLQGANGGELRIGASTTIAQYVIPQIIASFSSKFPNIQLSLTSCNSDDIEDKLMAHNIDLGLIEDDKRLPTLQYTHLMDDELVAIVSAKSKYARYDEVSLDQLVSIPLILRENGSGTLRVFINALEKKGVKMSSLDVLMQMSSSESIKHFLEHSDAMAIISFRCVTKELVDGAFKIIEIPEIEMKRELCFIQPQGEGEGLSEKFIQFALQM